MHYVNEQITKTFEHLLNLRHSIDTFLSSPKKSRIFYRINHQKLEKYRHKNQTPSIEVLSDKVIHRKTIGTQTTFTKESNSSNTLSIVSKGISKSDISIDLSSSSLTNTTTKILKKDSSIALDFSNESTSEISMTSDSNQIQSYNFNECSPKSHSTNGRIYIRSIVRHMFGDDKSDTELCEAKIKEIID